MTKVTRMFPNEAWLFPLKEHLCSSMAREQQAVKPEADPEVVGIGTSPLTAMKLCRFVAAEQFV